MGEGDGRPAVVCSSFVRTIDRPVPNASGLRNRCGVESKKTTTSLLGMMTERLLPSSRPKIERSRFPLIHIQAAARANQGRTNFEIHLIDFRPADAPTDIVRTPDKVVDDDARSTQFITALLTIRHSSTSCIEPPAILIDAKPE